MRTPGFFYIGEDNELHYSIFPMNGRRVSWFFLWLFWGDGKHVIIPDKPSLLFGLLFLIHYRGTPFSIKQIKNKQEQTAEIIPIDKRLDRAGYVQHPNFWQKGFVRCARFADRWEVWHDVNNPCKIISTEEDLFETLKYFERI